MRVLLTVVTLVPGTNKTLWKAGETVQTVRRTEGGEGGRTPGPQGRSEGLGEGGLPPFLAVTQAVSLLKALVFPFAN